MIMLVYNMINRRFNCNHPNQKCPVEFTKSQNTLVESTAINLAGRIQRFGGKKTFITRTDITNLGVAEGSSMANVRNPPRNF